MRPRHRVSARPGVGDHDVQAIRLARGEAVILDWDLRPFHDAQVRVAESGEVEAWFERVRPNQAALIIGEGLLARG